MNFFFLSSCILTTETQEWKLFTAITSNNLEAVKEVLAEDPKLDYENLSHGESTPFQMNDHRALALAMSNPDESVIAALLESGKVDPSTKEEYTYLDEALGNCSLEIVEMLLEYGADVNDGDQPALNGYVAFVYPKMEDKEERAELLLKYGATIDESVIKASLKNDWRYLYTVKLLEYADENQIFYELPLGLREAILGDDEGLRSLAKAGKIESEKEVVLFASASCSTETLQTLREAGCAFDLIDDSGLSPLHIACLCNDREVVEYLLKVGLDSEQTSEERYTPITYAAIGANAENIEVLLENGCSFQNGEEGTWSAVCSYGTADSIKAMQSVGYEPTQFDCYNAYGSANDDVFYALKEINILVVEQWDGEHTMDYATEEHVEWLLNEGVAPTSFIYPYAAEWRNAEMLKYLVREYPNPDAMAYAIESAIVYGDMESLEFLLSSGTDVNMSIDDPDCKTTPLHVAAENPSLNVVKYLLDHGADANAKDEEGRTPYACAKENGFEEIAKLLKP